jgi:hypothetical protein
MKNVRGSSRRPRPGRRSRSTLVYYATRSGGTTLDTGEGGGNPFASALIELADEQSLQLRNLAGRLRRLTAAKSGRHQITECAGDPRLPAWTFREDIGLRKEKRSALVLVVSDYSGFGPGASLMGAARDERRIAAMLAQHGFSVTQGIGRRRQELMSALVSFRHHCQGSDIGVIYSTGHGVERDGTVYLLPGDYPMRDGCGRFQLKRHAVSVTHMIHAASARGQNLVFFAGCRTHVVDIGAASPNSGRSRRAARG